jgi:hypothetical protein
VVEVVEVNGRWQPLQAVQKNLHRSPEIEVEVAVDVDLVVAVVEQVVGVLA